MSACRPWPRALALSPMALLAALFEVNTAHAEPFNSYGGGAFIGFDLADGSLTWGAEALATREFGEHGFCSSEPRTVAGPITRFALHGLSSPEFQFAAFGGTELERVGPGLLGELGLTLAFSNGFEEDAWLTPHTAVAVEASIFHAFLRQEWLIRSFPVGLGARFMPAFGEPGMCAIGRPQRDGTGAKTTVPDFEAQGRRGSASVGELAAEFRSLAQQEYESVPAFLQLASELRGLGAPVALIERALVAARDELVHTGLCAQLARAATGDDFVPRAPIVHRRSTLLGEAGLARLALESWLDGCLGEGLSADLARDIAERTSDERLRSVQLQIAVDEQRHAELGWDVLSWCIAVEPKLRGLVGAHAAFRVVPQPSVLGGARHRGNIALRQQRMAVQRLAAC